MTDTLRNGKWHYTIKAYRPINQGGGLVLETVHVGIASRDMELSVFRDRMARGEIDHVVVIEHVEPFRRATLYARDSLPWAPE